MFSAILQTADIRQGMPKPYRLTRRIPAWLTVDAIGNVDPAVSGTSTPSAPATNFSTIAECTIRSPSPIASTS